MSSIIALASDHAGFALKENLKKYLATLGYVVRDFGPKTMNPQDDYPDYAAPLARHVARTKGRGIVLCGNAEGVCIVANKIQGVRAGVGYSAYAVKTMRTDDDANVLCLPGRVLKKAQARRVVKVWLETKFSGAKRHKRRLRKIARIESKM